ncbi:thyrotropin-releasing hormone receptor-like [Mercenaria mercenaria]|uniref:thyrotropin-releasing hormone receptor-like n=1 Tax=Mercenaria mercenaria TaxID=6596 RepID=UPI00234E4CB4|nr:thyrotropin-releasing hormone receptor-like [Mercenaria mercenaria]
MSAILAQSVASSVREDRIDFLLSHSSPSLKSFCQRQRTMNNKMVLMGDVQGNLSVPAVIAEMMLNVDPNMTYLAMSPEEQIMFLESLETQLENQHLQHEIVLMELVEYRVHKVISLYIPPILLIMGTFGNMFSFLILRNKTMTRQSTNSFLSALALADSVVLFVGLLKNWIGEMSGLDIQNQADWLCKLTSLLIYSSSHFSVWLIIAVTIERYIAVSQPLHASRYCKLSRAKRVIALLTPLSK